ncbi:MAG: type IV pilus assembly protein PilM [Candidatus Eisenbacteria bacterium]|uniref:Type IV pilus assembly protein PilM n=1 Tax=Eiseniibacteriota bacterium TaxID=2212470 RepID=A0A7Y2H1P6_UNCEI|nr:type IV pilus assembly protein PilM [Candidatus Eisenbacteria bacterium]
MFFKRQKPMVGLDIGSSSIKVVQCESRAGEVHLQDYGTAELLPEAIVDGEIMDRQLVVETIQNLWESKGISAKSVSTAVSGRAVIVKKIQMERMAPEDAREAIQWEAEQHVPYDINDVSLDFQILEGNSDPKQMDVLLVAAKREHLVAHADLIRQAGLDPLIIDVDAFAVQNIMSMNYDLSPEDVLAMVNIGAEVTNINVVQNGMPLYTQDVSLGGASFVEALQKTFNISHAEALAAVKGEEQPNFDMQQVVETVAEDLAVAIERSGLYLKSAGETEEIDRVLITGGGTRVPGVVEFLNNRIEPSVEVADPLRRIHFDPVLFGDKRPEEISPSLTVGLGLALRKVDDR